MQPPSTIFFQKNNLIKLAVFVVIIAIAAGYFRFNALKSDVKEYLKYEVEIPRQIMNVYQAIDVFSFRDVPGYGGSFNEKKSSEMLRELAGEEQRMYDPIGSSIFKSFLAKEVVICAAQLNKKRNNDFEALRNILLSARFINMKEFNEALRNIDTGFAGRCLAIFNIDYPEPTKLISSESEKPEIKKNGLALPDIKQLTRDAENGDRTSQLELAVYYEGKLYQNEPDLTLAHKWYYEAAKRDNYLAQLALADLGFNAPRSILRSDFPRLSPVPEGGERQESIVDAIAWYEIARLGAKKNGSSLSTPGSEEHFLAKYSPSESLKVQGKQQAIQWRARQFGESAGQAEPEVVSKPVATVASSKRDPVQLVEEIVSAAKADKISEVDAPRAALDSFPKPERRDRKTARERNALGLDALKKNDFGAAIDRFTEGKNADPSDIELVNNLGYALMMAGKSDEAKAAFVETLTLDPSRGAAWSNLGQLHARMGDVSSAAACFKLTYFFSKAPEKTIEFYKKLAESDSDEKIRLAATKASSEFSTIQPLITSIRFQYQKALDALSSGPAGIGSPSPKIVDVLSNPVTPEDWKFIGELEADLGQCSTGSACARETEITDARDKRKAKGLRAQTR